VQPLSSERIVGSALELIDERGVDAVSMRAVASLLGCEAMSLYRHVPNKEALLQLVGQRVAAEIDVPDPEQGNWQEVIRDLMHALRGAALRHPAAFSLLHRAPVAALGAAPLEVGMAALQRGGLSEQRAASALCVLLAFAIGAISNELAAAALGGPLARAADAEGWDHAHRARRFLQLMEHTSYQAEFEAGVDTLLAGLGQRAA